MRRRAGLLLLLVAACDRRAAVKPEPLGSPPAYASGDTGGPALPESGPGSSARAKVRCANDGTFPGLWQVAEASAATEVSLLPGSREMLVVSDSGNDGEAILWGIPSGPFRKIRLSLDHGASDDLEGAAWTQGHLYTLTSSGAVRRYSADGRGGLARDGDAYPIGPVPTACATLTDVNCGPNYEGLCLRADPRSARCAGYAASKAKGTLTCVVFDGERLKVDGIRAPIPLAVPRHALSDCAFAAAGKGNDALVVTTNVYGGSTIYRVDEPTGELAEVDVPSLPNNEAVAIDADGALYELMDSDSAVSLAYRFTCAGW